MGAENRHGQSSYRKSCPISIYDVAAVETWLEDLARKGDEPRLLHGQPGGPVAGRTVGVPLLLQPLQRWKEALDPERVEAYRSMAGGWWGSWGPSGSGGAMTRMPRSWTRTRCPGRGIPILKAADDLPHSGGG